MRSPCHHEHLGHTREGADVSGARTITKTHDEGNKGCSSIHSVPAFLRGLLTRLEAETSSRRYRLPTTCASTGSSSTQRRMHRRHSPATSLSSPSISSASCRSAASRRVQGRRTKEHANRRGSRADDTSTSNGQSSCMPSAIQRVR